MILNPRLLLGLLAVLVLGFAGCHKEHPPHSVTLNWHAPSPVPGVHVVGYNVYRRTAPGNPYERIATQVPGPPYEDRIVNGGTSYSYAVTAVDQRGRESRFSTVVKVEVP